LEAIDRLLKVWSRYRCRVIGLIAGVLFGLLVLRFGWALLWLTATGIVGFLIGLVLEDQR